MSIINYRKVLKYLPIRLQQCLEKIPVNTAKGINEIRLRTNRPISVTVCGENHFVTENGSLTLCRTLGIICTSDDITESFRAVCEYSVHSYQKEISQGYITINGGNRVGICGTSAVNGNIETIKYISGLNFRISGQVTGCGEEICKKIYSEEIYGLLIVGEPLSGKTTLLRDICRILGERYRISVVDSRSEIAACCHGVPQNDVGSFTDIFDGCDKKSGIEKAIRVMSPQIVVCDEIGGIEDCNSIAESITSGVKFIATVHGKSIEEILKRKHIKRLMDYGIFEYGAVISDRKIKEIRKIYD